MGKEVISDKQGIVLVTLSIVASTIVLPTALEAGRDLWIAILVSIIMSIPVVMLYAKILYLNYGKDIFDILEDNLGKFLGKVIGLLYTWIAFFIGTLVLRDLGEFITTVSLTETPKSVPMIIFAFLSVWAVKEGIELLGRWGEFFITFFMIMSGIAIIFLIPLWELRHIEPILANGMKPILKGAYSTFTFPFAETILFTMVFEKLKGKKSYRKIFLVGLILGGGMMLITSFSEIMVLGINNYERAFFPAYITVSRVNIGDFLQRLEIIVAFVFLIGLFIKLSICILAACKGITKILGYKDYRFIVIPLTLLLICVSNINFQNIMEVTEWSANIWPYLAIPFEIIFPIVIYIAIRIKQRKKSYKSNIS